MAITPEQIDRFLRSPLRLGLIVLALLAVTGVVVGILLYFLLPTVQAWLSEQWIFSLVMLAVSLGAIGSAVPACILFERKIAGFVQDRKGPNRVGFWGLLQPVADGLKFLLKEDIIPANVDRPLFLLAPTLAMAISLLGFAIIPWAGEVRWPWMPADAAPLTSQVASLDVGFLYLLATASLGVYGVVLAGYASNNKYAFYGGMRATAQMLSYEVPLGLGLLTILLATGTLRLENMVNTQAGTGIWNVFMYPIAFVLVLTSAFAETNRTPFDLAECEQELVGGYHTEYSAMKFAMFFLGEYIHMVTNSALVVALFCGGWHFWGAPGPENTTWWAFLVKFAIYWAKIAFFLFVYMLVRWTIPRFRFDQLMRMAWKSMVPIGIALVAGTGLLVVLGVQDRLWASLGLNILLIIAALAISAKARTPVTGRQEHLPGVSVYPPAEYRVPS
jgi:NADH-quinone oxidoreductase subunit H